MDKKTEPLDDAKLEQVSGGASQEGIDELPENKLSPIVDKRDDSSLVLEDKLDI